MANATQNLGKTGFRLAARERCVRTQTSTLIVPTLCVETPPVALQRPNSQRMLERLWLRGNSGCLGSMQTANLELTSPFFCSMAAAFYPYAASTLAMSSAPVAAVVCPTTKRPAAPAPVG